MSFFGKLVKPDDIKSFPNRKSLLDPIAVRKTMSIINTKQPFLFMPTQILENHYFESNSLVYYVLLFGNTVDGCKACLALKNSEIFFEVRIPLDADPAVFKAWAEHRCNALSSSILEHIPFKGFEPQPVKYLRIWFTTTHDRKKALISFTKQVNYKNRSDITVYAVLETAYDDASNHYLKVARENSIKLSDWMLVSNYAGFKHCKSNSPLSVWCDIHDVQTWKYDIKTQGADDLLNPKCLVMSWDIETFVKNRTGDVPGTDDVYRKNKQEAVVNMVCMSFTWQNSTTSLLQICITTLPVPSHPNTFTILCKTQTEIIQVMSCVVERMAPDIMAGFNSGRYDTPFMVRHAEAIDSKTGTTLINHMKHQMSCIPYLDGYGSVIKGIDFLIREPTSKFTVKLEAGQNYDIEVMNLPGLMEVDVQPLFQQMFPKQAETSLNAYLKKGGLAAKEDMPYITMFRIHIICVKLAKLHGAHDYASVMSVVAAWDPQSCPFWNPLKPDGQSCYGINKFTGLQIQHMLGGLSCGGSANEGLLQVVHYCNADARACAALMKSVNLLSDRRETANLSYTCLSSALYKAGGMKVRNDLCYFAHQPEWNIAISNNSANSVKSSKKYPGGYVVPPKKGLRRDDAQVKAGRAKTCLDSSRIPSDENSISDRPVSDLDFASLYPNIMCSYNIDSSKYIDNPERAQYISSLGYEVIKNEFTFDYSDVAEKSRIHCWFVQHSHPSRAVLADAISEAQTVDPVNWLQHVSENKIASISNEFRSTTPEQWRDYGMGLMPFRLLQLTVLRKKFKADMNRYEHALEFLNVNIGHVLMNSISHLEFSEQKAAVAAVGFSKFLNEEWISGSILQMFDTCDIRFTYYNGKQLSVKVYMNTFYGETGAQHSPLFTVQVAGSITTLAQKNTRMMKQFITDQGYDIVYGDTDSLYFTPPQHEFQDIDLEYYCGAITKLQYWHNMIELTMKLAPVLQALVNKHLMCNNLTGFLQMMYEEVMFPCMFLGLKKNCGVSHMGAVNLRPCSSECSLEEFMNPKNKYLHIRGLEIIKRGSSEYLASIVYNILRDAFNINETRTLKTIIEQKLDNIHKEPTKLSAFSKSARYRLPIGDAPGNISVLGFIARMKKVVLENPGIGIKIPEVGERFNYVVTKKYPWTYDLKGRQKNIGASDKYEFVDSFANPVYQSLVGALEVDMDYYVENEVAGQLARIIIYHPDYDQFFEEDMDDEAYKIADKKAHGAAKKSLAQYYKSTHLETYENHGKKYKSAYKLAMASAQTSFENISDSVVYALGTSLVIDGVDNSTSLHNALLESARNIAKKRAKCISFNDVFSGDATTCLISNFTGKNCFMAKKMNDVSAGILDCETGMLKYIPDLLETSKAGVCRITQLVEDKHADDICFSESMTLLVNLYYDLIGWRIVKEQYLLLKSSVEAASCKTTGLICAPASVGNLADKFEIYQKSKKSEEVVIGPASIGNLDDAYLKFMT